MILDAQVPQEARKRRLSKNHLRRTQSRAAGERRVQEGGTKKALPKESRKVRGMIEVTDKESGRKIMVNISYLEVVFDEGMTASLCLMMHSPSRKATHYTIETEETYWEVKELIAQAQD